jgi:hypothetical protein
MRQRQWGSWRKTAHEEFFMSHLCRIRKEGWLYRLGYFNYPVDKRPTTHVDLCTIVVRVLANSVLAVVGTAGLILAPLSALFVISLAGDSLINAGADFGQMLGTIGSKILFIGGCALCLGFLIWLGLGRRLPNTQQFAIRFRNYLRRNCTDCELI